MILRTTICFCLLIFTPAVATRVAADIYDDFTDGNFDGWTTENNSAWEVSDGILRQKSSGDSTGNWFHYFASMNTAQIEGDFTLAVKAGFNPAAYPMKGQRLLDWKIYYRSLAFGIMKDRRNGLLATFQRTNGRGNGIVRIAGGKEIWLCRPYSGQGVGLEIHNLRELVISRRCRTVTVYADSQIIYQATDTTSGALINGRPVVCGPGPVGLAIDEISLSPAAPTPPLWQGPEEKTDFIFHLDEGKGYLISDESGKYRGTVETGKGLFGLRHPDGTCRGHRSWVASGGQLTISSYTMGPQATLETWFKLLDVSVKGGVPIIQLVFDGKLIDPAWSARERGGPIAEIFPDSSIGLHFHEFGDVMGDVPDIFRLDEWTHLAWVRNGSRHAIFVNGEEVFSVEMKKYGDKTLKGIQLNMAQNADHDWLTRLGRPYILIDNLRAVSRALEPEEFLKWNGHQHCDSTRIIIPLGSKKISYSPTSRVFHLPLSLKNDVTIEIVDNDCRVVRNLYEGTFNPGYINTFLWDYKDDNGERVAGGIYFCRVRSGDYEKTRKVVLLR